MTKTMILTSIFFIVVCVMSTSAKNCVGVTDLCTCTEDSSGMKTVMCQDLNITQYVKAMNNMSNLLIHSLILQNVNVTDGVNAWNGFEIYKKMKSVKFVDVPMTFKNLKSVSVDFEELIKLEVIGNFTEQNMTSNIFRNLIHLEHLEFTGGRINEIAKDTFSALAPNLKILKLEGNKLTKVPVDAIVPLTNLTTLSLDSNPITAIDATTVQKLKASLKNLKNFMINSLKCSCDTYTSKLREWVKTKEIKNVMCGKDNKELENIDIASYGKEKFCGDDGGSYALSSSFSVIMITLFTTMFLLE